MYAGRFVETGGVRDVIAAPLHPYTSGLLRSTVHGKVKAEALRPIPGAPPDLRELPAGCAFAPRCPAAAPLCRERTPPPVRVGTNREAHCHFVVASWDHS